MAQENLKPMAACGSCSQSTLSTSSGEKEIK